MTEVLEYAARLSQVIGPRPGGTEEEQQASFIIEETLKSNGLETSIEEFNCNPNYELPRIICCIVSIVLAVLAIFLPLMLVPAIIVCALMAALFIMEVVGISPLNNMAKRGISQNVVAKYIPGEQGLSPESTGSLSLDPEAIDPEVIPDEMEDSEPGGRTRSRSKGRQKGARKRKIIVLARYDSGKVCRELNQPIFGVLTTLRWVEMVGIALIPVLILLRTVVNPEGGVLVFWNVMIALGALCAFLPVLGYILHQTAPFTDGANNNASGVAVMMEVARRLSEGARTGVLEAEPDSEKLGLTGESGHLPLPTMHGEEAVRESGMLPVGTDLVYHEAVEGADLENAVPGEAARAEGLVTDGVASVAKPEGLVGVAVAGAPATGANMDAARADANPANATDTIPVTGSTGAGTASMPPAPAIIEGPEDDPTLPDWFRKGLKAAKANAEASGHVQEANVRRSRFADALDAAAEASAHSIEEFEARDAAKTAAFEAAGRTASGIDEERLRQMRESIANNNVAAKAEVAAVAAEIAASEAEAAKKAAEEAAAKAEARVAHQAELTPEEAVSKAGSTLQADVAAAIGAQQAEKAAAAAQAVEEVAEQAAVADRTISYIPVAAEIPAEISASEISEVSAVDSVGKSAADILEEASAKASEGDPKSAESGRRKRSISLPSLTGAIEGAKTKHQDAPLADDAERADGEKREALKSAGRRVRSSLMSLPSTDLPPKGSRSDDSEGKADASEKGTNSASTPVASASESVSATVVAAKEGSTTSFLAAAEKEDAKAAFSSLDAPVSAPLQKKGSAQPAAGEDSASDSVSGSSSRTPGSTGSVSVSPVGSFVAASSTSQFQPVGDELIADVVEEDIVVLDADDSDYTENITRTGAMAGPGYVEMPKSRASRLRSLFSRKKKRDDSISFSEAVGIDEGFDAREVGAARGGWESFQNESADYDAGTMPAISGDSPDSDDGSRSKHADKKPRRSHVDEYSTNSRSLRNRTEDWGGDAWDDDWNGGAFSTLRDHLSGGDDGNGTSSRGSSRSQRDGAGRSARSGRGSLGEGSSRRNSRGEGAGRSQRRRNPDEFMDAGNGMADDFDGRPIGAEDMLDEREQIRSFRTGSAPLASFADVAAYASAFSTNLADDAAAPQQDEVQEPQQHGFQTEVWFVALGSELADNAGIKSFISQHSDDLRGSVFIDLDAMGAGDLSLIDEEGVIRRVKASPRMKRYVTKAGTSIGLHINSVKMNWRESAAYYTNRKGLQTIHVAGMRDGKPAYLGEADDKFENLSEEKLLENTAFVLELLNTI